jgi:group II intron reverse transcriptase/maturase
MGAPEAERRQEVSRGHSSVEISVMEMERRTESIEARSSYSATGTTMKSAENNQVVQMSLSDEWANDIPTVHGADVFCPRTGRVRAQWLSACGKERALTQDLMADVCELSNLVAALRQVVKNGGCSGVDGMSTGELKEWLNSHHRELQETLLHGGYKPDLVKGIEIPKPNGGVRLLGIPTVKDRMVQQAVAQVLSKRYEPTFSSHSYGFRPKRSAHQALSEAGSYVRDRCNYIVDIDLEKFFDKVNHDRLMWLLGRRISDKRLLKLIGDFLRTGIMTGGLINQRVSGTPQGSPLSPLLSNIVLDELDKELERRGHRFVRYADDMILFVKSEESAIRVMASVSRFIEDRLRLKVNRDKSRICRPHELNYLGHTILGKGSLGLSQTSEKRLKEKVRKLTRRNRGISLEQLVRELNLALTGWCNYFRSAKMLSKLKKIDSWIRRKVRCFKLKQCKRAKGIIKFLTGLGVPRWRSVLVAVSHKGWFRKSATPQAHEGMSSLWFQKIGLVNLADYYSSIFIETAQYESTLGGVRGQ